MQAENRWKRVLTPLSSFDVLYQPVGFQPVPIILLPSIQNLESLLTEPSDLSDQIGRAKQQANDPVGRTLFFNTGPSSKEYTISLPTPWGTKFNGNVNKGDAWRSVTKYVYRNTETLTPSPKKVAGLRLNQAGGATELGTMLAVPAALENGRVRLVKLWLPNGKSQHWFAFVIGDANGCKRDRMLGPEGESGFARPILAPFDPKIGSNSLLRIPRPLPAGRRLPGREEELTLTSWYGQHAQKIWALRLEADSTPFSDSIVVCKPDQQTSLSLHGLLIFADASADQMAEAITSIAAQ